MKTLGAVVVWTGVLVVAACATSSYIVTGKVRPAIQTEQVQIYSTAPPGSEEVAILSAER